MTDDTHDDDPLATDGVETSSGRRYDEYKRRCRLLGREPLAWGAWLDASQPLPEVPEP